MKTFALILLCFLPALISAQALNQFTGDTIPCYKALCPHPKTYQEAFLAPWDGCIGFDQAAPGWGSLVLVIDNKIVLDTCILTPGTGIPTQVCWSSTDSVKVFYYGPDSTSVGIWHFPGSGYPPLLNIIAITDTLCPLPLSIDRPIEQEDAKPIDIITGQRVSFMQPNRVYLVGRKLQMRIE